MRRDLADRVRIFTTLDPRTGRRVQKILESVRPYPGIVTNLGPLAHADVESWFDRTDALFLPTLLESCSLTYLEAAARARPVLTSDRDFARHACGAEGYYFDPHDPADIADRVAELIGALEQGRLRVPPAAGSWDGAARSIVETLRAAASRGERAPRPTLSPAVGPA
jgi:glycosyltransferase involved in cell wall biosynthesis